MQKELITVKDRPGAHYLADSRETPEGVTATVQLIGAESSYDVPLTDLTAYTRAPIAADLDPITHAAQVAVIRYRTDPARTQRAANIVRAGNNIYPRATYAVIRSESYSNYTTPGLSADHAAKLRKVYQVSKGNCSCEDTKRQKDTPCKHRIALFIFNEINPPLGTPRAYFEKRHCPECMTVHFMEIPPYDLDPICNGENYAPVSDSAHYVRRSGRGYEVIAYTPVQFTRATVNAAH